MNGQVDGRKTCMKNIYKTYNPSQKVFLRIGKKRGKFVFAEYLQTKHLQEPWKKDIKMIPS